MGQGLKKNIKAVYSKDFTALTKVEPALMVGLESDSRS
jgi:hypothetical protein